MGEKIIGILGGMGPEATADLFHRIIKSTQVECDQDHPRTIIYSNSKVPDRTAAIMGKGPSPLSEMIMAAAKLEKAGADFIIIPCNTAHYFIGELRKEIDIPILDMIELTAKKIKKEYPEIIKVGLLATTGTLKSKIYHHKLSTLDVSLISPSKEIQHKVMDAIYQNIKTGDLKTGREILLKVAENLIKKTAQMIICGCTEVSMVLKDGDLRVPILDPMQVLAETAVKIALEKSKTKILS